MRRTTEAQERVLESLARMLPDDAYLAGGVAVSLHCGHRESHDLDFFVTVSDPLTLEEALLGLGEVTIDSRAEGTVYATVEGVPISRLRYAPTLKAAEVMTGVPVPVASLVDLGCMKLRAISKRGAARDFWDLYEILRRVAGGLPELLTAFEKKHPRVDTGHVVRSLVYFGDAESEPRPRGLDAALWHEIRTDLERRVRALD